MLFKVGSYSIIIHEPISFIFFVIIIPKSLAGELVPRRVRLVKNFLRLFLINGWKYWVSNFHIIADSHCYIVNIKIVERALLKIDARENNSELILRCFRRVRAVKAVSGVGNRFFI